MNLTGIQINKRVGNSYFVRCSRYLFLVKYIINNVQKCVDTHSKIYMNKSIH